MQHFSHGVSRKMVYHDDLFGGDVFAPGNNDVLDAVREIIIAVAVHLAEVTRPEPLPGKGVVKRDALLKFNCSFNQSKWKLFCL